MATKKSAIVVLGGGAARGFAHIGVLEAVEKAYDIRGIIGTSMGSIIGGLYACGYKSTEILQFAQDINPLEMLTYLKMDVVRGGLVRRTKLHDYLSELTHDIKIQYLHIPFRTVAFDLVSRKSILFDQGDLADAMIASSSLPFIFKPYEYGDYRFVDGGIQYPLPVEFARLFDKKYEVIAVNVLPPIENQTALYDPESIVAIDEDLERATSFYQGIRSTEYMQAFLSLRSLNYTQPDILISAYDESLEGWDFMKADAFYRLGLHEGGRFLSAGTSMRAGSDRESEGYPGVIHEKFGSISRLHQRPAS